MHIKKEASLFWLFVQERDSPFSPASGTQSVGVTPAAIGPEEEQRRLRMSQVTGEEDAVSERLTQRKRRKRRTKKHSSKPSELRPYNSYIRTYMYIPP